MTQLLGSDSSETIPIAHSQNVVRASVHHEQTSIASTSAKGHNFLLLACGCSLFSVINLVGEVQQSNFFFEFFFQSKLPFGAMALLWGLSFIST